MLLNDYAHRQNYEVVREVYTMGTKGAKVKPDGILKNLWGIEIGLWESKDEKDDIDAEIDAKQKKGYPLTNILFEDSQTAVLFQRGEMKLKVNMRDEADLDKIIKEFVAFKNETIYKFEDAIEKFKADIPTIVEAFRKRIEEASAPHKDPVPLSERREPVPKLREVGGEAFIEARDIFLKLCQAEINPAFTLADVREMMIQHILTSDIFNKIFDDPEFHRHNTIAAELEKLISTLFTYSERKNLLGSIEHYYDTINAAAAGIADHHEKQKFLKVLYENFYKVYNPKAADRLGVVYTPNEIVKFMIESTTYLLDKHFGKTLSDKNVEILDPATGTGTFITSIIDSIPRHLLAYKYQNEIHANEVSILPYYVANLNMEFTFKQKMGYYEEFKNLCFVDTLDNITPLKGVRRDKGRQIDIFGLTSENSARIKRQNEKKISVVIGNPPYNANQANENDNNKNREYPAIDKHIQETYIEFSKAQKPKVYDMYARFYRWASDRIDKNGIIAFITNRSFIDSKTFDGFRKCIQDDYTNSYIIDLGGDIRSNMGRGKSIGNVFGIITGIAIMFLIKKEKQEGKCKIEYVKIEDALSKDEKLEWLRNSKLENIEFERISSDKNNNWLDISDTDFDTLLPLVDKVNKLSENLKNNQVIFRYYSNGCVTNRDEWVYSYDSQSLEKKIKYFFNEYNGLVKQWQIEFKTKKYFNKKADQLLEISIAFVFSKEPTIKWSGRLFRDKLLKQRLGEYDNKHIRICIYRPYVKRLLYYDYIPIDIQGQLKEFFPKKTSQNVIININGNGKDFHCLCSDSISDLHFTGDCSCIPLYKYNINGERIDNITDWGLQQFKDHYQLSLRGGTTKQSPDGSTDNKIASSQPGTNPAAPRKDVEGDVEITKEDIFHYTYAVLHNPAYRKKYELNLKREFPRIPFYENFFQWRDWGKQLMELHINYETVQPYNLTLHTHETKAETKKQKEIFSKVEEPEVLFTRQPKIKVKLKADKEAGIIEIDELTFLRGVPKEAWEYKLGNRSALEWILDQYKEKKPTDPTIAEKFNTYKFADYKDKVIDLLKRVCTVSVETMKVVEEMPE